MRNNIEIDTLNFNVKRINFFCSTVLAIIYIHFPRDQF